MSKGNPLVINSRDLPLPIILEGENGMCEVYTLSPAGRKFGASLQKVMGSVRRLLLQEARTSFPTQGR